MRASAGARAAFNKPPPVTRPAIIDLHPALGASSSRIELGIPRSGREVEPGTELLPEVVEQRALWYLAWLLGGVAVIDHLERPTPSTFTIGGVAGLMVGYFMRRYFRRG